jgi:predicted DNA-binding transcriptional regulator AlpA
MNDEIVLMREVVRRTKRHRSTIYRWMERDEFPRQLRTKCGRAIGWSRMAFESWMRSPAGADLLGTRRE